MLRTMRKLENVCIRAIAFHVIWISLLLSFATPACLNAVGEQASRGQTPTRTANSNNPVEGLWDQSKYIDINEIKPGMEAYCLTDYGEQGVEKFALKILEVVRDMEPGRDAILVRGTDERFIHTGPVGGCSGSPVYIEGRLAGALAFAWTFSKDPLYGVTPIREMLMVGQGNQGEKSTGKTHQASLAFDFSKPIDFAEVSKQISANRPTSNAGLAGATFLPCPLLVSGLSTQACEHLRSLIEPLGLMVVPGISGNVDSKDEKTELYPGSPLTVPLITGDVKMTVLGTATDVTGDTVYAFGHYFLGYGDIDFPMATGKIYTVVSNVARSFKLGSAGEIVGAIRSDERAAILGQLGATARMLPLTIQIERFNDTQTRVYNCRVAYNKLLTPGLIQSAISGAAFYLGDFPPDHTIEYSVNMNLEHGESIRFENISTGRSLSEMMAETEGSTALLMNNPFGQVGIESVECNVRIVPKNITSHIWSVNLYDSKVKAGEQIRLEAVIESFLAERKKYQFNFELPQGLAPGKYGLILCGPHEYERFLRKAAPYKFLAQDIPSLITALNNALAVDRNRLYCILALPAGGVAIDRAELPDLPATKILVLQDGKRALQAQEFPHWLEKSVETDTIVLDKKLIQLTVEP